MTNPAAHCGLQFCRISARFCRLAKKPYLAWCSTSAVHEETWFWVEQRFSAALKASLFKASLFNGGLSR
jgi:hypothetical protein